MVDILRGGGGNLRAFYYRAPRFPAVFSFSIVSESGDVVLATCEEISDAGMGAHPQGALSIGSFVTLIVPRANRALRIRARVVSQSEQRYGFHFEPQFASEWEEIALLVAELRSEGEP